MIIYLVNSIENDKIEINDKTPSYTIDARNEYLLNFTDGTLTLQAFKELYFLGKDIFVLTSNLEYFLCKIRQFKYIKIIKQFERQEKENRITKYLNLESKIFKNSKTNSRKKTQFLSKKKDGVKITFNPKIYSSIHSSLIDPSLYFHKENTSSLIFKETKKNKITAEDLRKKFKKVTEKEFSRSLKSLLFCRIILNKEDQLFVNPLLEL